MPGMKEGIGDDPFDDDSESKPDETQTSIDSEPANTAERTREDSSTDSSRSLPYIYSRDSVKDGRQQRPVFLREKTEAGIGDLVNTVEDNLGEVVYQTDVLEAAMEVALEHPELVTEKCREYGYDWE